MKKKLGVIGGMGPEASYYFYKEVIGHTKADCDQEHIDMVLLNHASMPDRTKAILEHKSEEFLKAVEGDLKLLEAAGCGNIAITCNTSHYFYDKIQAMTKIPVIHMVREAAQAAAKMMPGVKKIGIMGTDGTIRAGVYSREIEALGLEALSPGEAAQKAVMSLIYEDVKSGKAGDPKKFKMAYEDLKSRGADVIILACTEISVFKSGHSVPMDCLDAMDVLVRCAIVRSGAEWF